MSKTKRKLKQQVDNPLEKLFGTALDDILGISKSAEKTKKEKETLLVEGQEVSLADFQEKNTQKQETRIDPGLNYSGEIVHAAEKIINYENREIEVQLREIMIEIKKLADSSRELQVQFKDIAVEQRVVKPGKYHKNFFSWLLSVIRSTRAKVEDSGVWLAAMHSKKKSKEYWAMSKKAGTSFSLSNERTVATQVG